MSPSNASPGPDSSHDRSLLRRAALGDAARTAQARDLLLIHGRGADDLTLVEGLICAERWCGRMELDLGAEALLAEALAGDVVLRVAPPAPRRMVGPFWSTSAAFVPWHGEDESIVALFGGVDPAVSDATLRDAADAARGLVPHVDPTGEALRELHELDDVLRWPSDSVSEAMERLADGARVALRSDAVVVWVNEGRRAVGRARTWPEHQVEAVASAVAEICLTGGEPLLAQRLGDTAFADPNMPAWRDVAVIDLPEVGKLVSLALARSAQPRDPSPSLRSRIATVGSLVVGTALTRERLSWHAEHARSVLHRDPLTGLLNRDGWTHALRRLTNDEGDRVHTVLRLDLACAPGGRDHHRDDDELQQVAAALQAAARGDDLMARLDERELALLVHEADVEAATAPEIAARVRERLTPLSPELVERVSIGWAVADHARAIGTALDDAHAGALRCRTP